MIERMESIAKSTVEEFNLTFKEWDKRIYNSKIRVLNFVPEDMQNMSDRQVMAEILHNIWHALFSVDIDRSLLQDPKRKFSIMVNTFEDIRMEEHMMMKYPWVYDNFLYKFRKQDSEISSSIEEKLTPDLQFLYFLWYKFWSKDIIKIAPEVKEALDEVEDRLYGAYSQKSFNDLCRYLTKEIRPVYKRLIPPEEITNDKEKEELKKVEKIATSLDSIVKSMKKMSKEKENDEKEEFGKDIDKELDWEIDKYGQDDPVLWESDKRHKEEQLAQDDFMSYEQMYKEVLPMIPFFVKKLGSIMKDNKHNREWWAYRSWKLNNKKLYKRKCDSDKIFSRKINKKHKDYVVGLLVDESGSMCSNEKNRNAAKGTVLLSEVLHKVWIPFEIRWFNATNRCYKKANEWFCWKHRRQIERIILESHNNDAYANNDGYSLNTSAYHLNRIGNSDTERILIVLSDWLPADSPMSIPKEDKKRSKKNWYSEFDLHYEIAQSNCICIWIWINASHVADYYPNNVIVNNIEDLSKQLMTQLKKHIKRW